MKQLLVKNASGDLEKFNLIGMMWCAFRSRGMSTILNHLLPLFKCCLGIKKTLQGRNYKLDRNEWLTC